MQLHTSKEVRKVINMHILKIGKHIFNCMLRTYNVFSLSQKSGFRFEFKQNMNVNWLNKDIWFWFDCTVSPFSDYTLYPIVMKLIWLKFLCCYKFSYFGSAVSWCERTFGIFCKMAGCGNSTVNLNKNCVSYFIVDLIHL